MSETLAALLHDLMPDEDNWRQFFHVVDDEGGGWWLEIRRALSEHLARGLTARGVRVGDEGLRDVADRIRQHTAGAGADLETLAVLDRAGDYGNRALVNPALGRLERHLRAIDDALTVALAATPTAPEIDVLRAEIERLCVSWQTAVPVDVLRSVLEAKS